MSRSDPVLDRAWFINIYGGRDRAVEAREGGRRMFHPDPRPDEIVRIVYHESDPHMAYPEVAGGPFE